MFERIKINGAQDPSNDFKLKIDSFVIDFLVTQINR